MDDIMGDAFPNLILHKVIILIDFPLFLLPLILPDMQQLLKSFLMRMFMLLNLINLNWSKPFLSLQNDFLLFFPYLLLKQLEFLLFSYVKWLVLFVFLEQFSCGLRFLVLGLFFAMTQILTRFLLLGER